MKQKRILLITIILAMFILAVLHVTRTTKDSENITCPQVCVSQWLEDVITIEETLHCIEDYMKKTNGSECKNGDYNI
ncbi:MAG: hypothetical protein ACYTFW_02965 [Planctomycetota bacterium]